MLNQFLRNKLLFSSGERKNLGEKNLNNSGNKNLIIFLSILCREIGKFMVGLRQPAWIADTDHIFNIKNGEVTAFTPYTISD